MEFRRLFDILLHQHMHFPQKAALSVRNNILKQTYSTQDCLDECMRVSAGALSIGLERGDKVAIISQFSSAKWTFLDIGLMQIGIIPTTLHAGWDKETLLYSLKDCSPKVAFVDNREMYEVLTSFTEEIPHLKIYSFEEVPDLPHWEEFLKAPLPEHFEKYETSKAAIHEDDIATIVYTSGTTKKPKGVILSHKNMVSSIQAIIDALPFKASHHVVSMLPQVLISERVMIYAYLALGCKIHFVRQGDTLLEELQQIRPHYFTCLPAILYKMYSSIIDQAMKGKEMLDSRYIWALRQGRLFENYGKVSIPYFFKLRLADFLVFRHWRNAFGGRIESILISNDAISPSFARLFSAAGIDIRNSYAMVETSSFISTHRLGHSDVNFSTVGQAMEGVESTKIKMSMAMVKSK